MALLPFWSRAPGHIECVFRYFVRPGDVKRERESERKGRGGQLGVVEKKNCY